MITTTDLKETFFDTGEVRLRVMEGPKSGPPLVLLHGATGRWDEWMPVLPTLVERWHVYALDNRGHGQSGRAADVQGYHIGRNVDDTVAFLRQGVAEPALLWGHSWGAVVALLCGGPASERLRGLVLEDPPLVLRRPSTENKGFLNFFRALYELKQTATDEEAVYAALRSMDPQTPEPMLRFQASIKNEVDAAFVLALLGNREPVQGVDFEQAAAAVECPILLLQADLARGSALLPEDVAFLQQHAKHLEQVYFEGTGHGIHMEKPKETLAAFEAFAKKLS